MPAPDSAVRSVVAVRRPRAASASAAAMQRPSRPASRGRTRSSRRPRRRTAARRRAATTTWPASRQTWAMPAPIVPSPTTPTVPIDTRLPPLASAVIVLAAQAGKRRYAGYTGSMARFRDRLRMGCTRPQRRGRDRRRTGHRDHRAGCRRGSPTPSSPASWPPPSRYPAATRARPAARAPGPDRPSTSGRSRDLGGLVVEMARRGVHNHALVDRRAADVVELERRIAELDGRLLADGRACAAATSPCPPLMAQLERRPCRPPRRARRCHALLANDANFCAYCGAPRERR